jgi:hypothetical protein
MFNKAALLSAILPLVAGLTLDYPKNLETAAPATITWNFQPSDPVFSLYLVNEAFHDSFAIANNVLPTQGSIDITLPVVPVGDGYTLKAVNVGNINDVYSETAGFSVAQNPNASSVPPLSSTTVTSVASSSSTKSAGSSSATKPVTTITPGTSSGFGVTVSASSTASSTGSSTASSAAATSNAAGTPVKFGGNAGAIAVVFFSAVAGAAVFAL